MIAKTDLFVDLHASVSPTGPEYAAADRHGGCSAGSSDIAELEARIADIKCSY